jgi:hypothetical protein
MKLFRLIFTTLLVGSVAIFGIIKMSNYFCKNSKDSEYVYSEKCQETLRQLKYSLDKYYHKFNKYPESKGDELFRELYAFRGTVIPFCRVRLGREGKGDMDSDELKGELKTRVDYETWTEGISEEALSSPPDGYPLFWDKKGNHNGKRNVVIISNKYIEHEPDVSCSGPIAKYIPVVISFTNENVFEEYLKRFPNK